MKFNKPIVLLFFVCILPVLTASVSITDQEPTTKEISSQIIGVRALDVDGNVHKIGIVNKKVMPVVVVFLEIGCPISERYIPMLNRLAAAATEKEVGFYGVIAHPQATWREAKKFRDEFNITFPLLFDGNSDLALRFNPTVVPESFVVDVYDRLIYYGRINDQYEDIGKFNKVERSADLKMAIDAAAKRTTLPYTHKKAIGCIFTPKVPETSNITYNKHIDPIIQANCTSCHSPGEIGPFSLRDYNEVTRRAQMVQYVTESRLMPIWKAKPGFGKFSNEHYLSDHQISLIRDWVVSGTPEGQPENLMVRTKASTQEWKLGQPDMVLEMESYDLPAEGDDQYRVFVLKGVVPKGKILKGFEFIPGDKSVVHHTTLFVDYTGTLKKYDKEDPLPGYDAFKKGGTMEFGSAIPFGGWAPGIDPYTYPKGIGFYIESNADLAIENHYHLSGKATTDVSKVGLYFANSAEINKYATGSIVGSQKLHIKADESDHTRKIWTYVPADILLTDISPHMHYIGKSTKLEIIDPTGARSPLLHVQDWDLRWQSAYTLREPLLVKEGSIIEGTFTYDNTDDNHDNPFYPAQDMFWGWGSNDEMLEFYLTYVPLKFQDYGKMLGASFAAFEHFYDADRRVNVTGSNLPAIFESFRQVDLWSDEGQILLISIVEAGLADKMVKMFNKEKNNFKKDSDFNTNYAWLLASAAYFSYDENRMYSDGNKAADIVTKVLTNDETHWNATYTLAKILIDSEYPKYVKQGVEILESVIEYQESLPQKDKYFRLYLELGQYYYTIKNDSRARAILQRGLQRHPNNPELLQTFEGDGRIQKKELN